MHGFRSCYMRVLIHLGFAPVHVAYTWYSDDTAIGLTLCNKFEAYSGYCDISSNMYQIDNPDVLFLNAGIGNTDILSSINEWGKEQYSNTK